MQMSKVNTSRGAPMGRHDASGQPEGRCQLFRVRLDSGGYDDGGAYWGIGQPLYCLRDEDGDEWFVRADDRALAWLILSEDRDMSDARLMVGPGKRKVAAYKQEVAQGLRNPQTFKRIKR